MTINYTTNELGFIDSWQAYPFDPTLPSIEVENPQEEIILDYTRIVNEKLVVDKERYEHDRLVQNIRFRRERECFAIVNRGEVWYNMLTNEQKEELQVWYRAWLDAPETLIIPEKPHWL